MSTVYTGVPGNIGALTPVTATIPADGVDPLSAASVNAALQKLTDYIAYLETISGPALLQFGGIPGTATSASYFATLAGYGNGAMPVTSGVANGTLITLPVACRITGMWLAFTNTTINAGTISFQAFINGAAAGPFIALAPAGVAPANFTAVGTIAVPAGQSIGVRVFNNAGVTTGPGQCTIGLLLSLG